MFRKMYGEAAVERSPTKLRCNEDLIHVAYEGICTQAYEDIHTADEGISTQAMRMIHIDVQKSCTQARMP